MIELTTTTTAFPNKKIRSELKLKEVAKAMGKVFACGASVSDTASGGKEIVIQGDVLDPLAAMLEDKYNVGAISWERRRGMAGSSLCISQACLAHSHTRAHFLFAGAGADDRAEALRERGHVLRRRDGADVRGQRARKGANG